jgi:excisionase family DNA binding protein
MLVLMPCSELIGNISTPKLNIVEGAIFDGKCQMMREQFNLEEVSKYLELDISSVIEMANAGTLPAARNGSDWNFDRTKIDKWISLEKAKG